MSKNRRKKRRNMKRNQLGRPQTIKKAAEPIDHKDAKAENAAFDEEDTRRNPKTARKAVWNIIVALGVLIAMTADTLNIWEVTPIAKMVSSKLDESNYSMQYLNSLSNYLTFGDGGITASHTSYAMLLTYNGDDPKTIIEIRRDVDYETMTGCIPEIDEDGRIGYGKADPAEEDILLAHRHIELKKGQPRLVFFSDKDTAPVPVTKKGDSARYQGQMFTLPKRYELYFADSSSVSVKPTNASNIQNEHYTGMPGYEESLERCQKMVNSSNNR